MSNSIDGSENNFFLKINGNNYKDRVLLLIS